MNNKRADGKQESRLNSKMRNGEPDRLTQIKNELDKIKQIKNPSKDDLDALIYGLSLLWDELIDFKSHDAMKLKAKILALSNYLKIIRNGAVAKRMASTRYA